MRRTSHQTQVLSIQLPQWTAPDQAISIVFMSYTMVSDTFAGEPVSQEHINPLLNTSQVLRVHHKKKKHVLMAKHDTRDSDGNTGIRRDSDVRGNLLWEP